MAEGEVAALKETLCNQYIIMKKLYAELEKEREASATAASEALSMILRLQREKAAEKMEACQYKRMAEEKMHHADECLAILEEVTQQKEMEIASLRFQLQANRQKLLSSGVDIPDVGEMRIVECPPFSGSNALLGVTSFQGFVRRNISLPSLRCDLPCSEIYTIDDDSPLLTRRQSFSRKIGDFTNQLSEKYEEGGMSDLSKESAIQDGNSDWKQAEEVNKNASEVGSVSSIASNELQTPPSIDYVSSELESTTCSWYSAMSSDTSCDLTTGGIGMKLDDESVLCLPPQAEERPNIPGYHVLSNSCLKTESKGNAVHSACVHDVYEIPESYKGCSTSEPCKQVLEESILETKNMMRMFNLKPEEAMDYLFRDDEWLDKAYMNTHNGSKLSTPRKGAFLQNGSKLPTPRKGTSVNYHLALLDPKIGIASSQTDFEQLKIRLRQLEGERIVMQEDSGRGKEQLKLLREIFKQINTIETHIKNTKSKKSSQQDDSSLVSVMEAVLCFSI